MNKLLQNYISEQLLQKKIKSYIPLSGGDISNVYLLKDSSQRYLLKTHKGKQSGSMFTVEKKGLETILNSKAIKTPQVYFLDALDDTSILIMEYIESKIPDPKDFEKLGHQLAELHQNNVKQFGFDSDNFIGSLHQSNTKHSSWSSFYIIERLLPQLNLAKKKSLLSEKEIPSSDKLYKICNNLFPKTKPSLVHGDLWNGNFLISTQGIPYLIDPAIYYGHGEVDLAMSKLFGGFATNFYKAYHEVTPRVSGENERNDLYQLYYLLVHLNLFGKGYYMSVKRILNSYF